MKYLGLRTHVKYFGNVTLGNCYRMTQTIHEILTFFKLTSDKMYLMPVQDVCLGAATPSNPKAVRGSLNSPTVKVTASCSSWKPTLAKSSGKFHPPAAKSQVKSSQQEFIPQYGKCVLLLYQTHLLLY